MVDYKNIEFQLHENLVKLQELLIALEADDQLIAKVEENKSLIISKKYTIAVMGEFNRGKSSLINALLGSRILPEDVTPTTATINRIIYGLTPKAIINYIDGNSEEIDILHINNYVTKLSKSGEEIAQRIKEAVITTPTVICQNHVEIIDTPGLNDDEKMTKVTLDMLGSVDGVILAISARAPFSDTEKKFVCKMLENENINNIIFVVTFIDTLDEDEVDCDEYIDTVKQRICNEVFKELKDNEPCERILIRAHDTVDNINIFGVSSKLALKAFVSNNRKLLKDSRFEKFKEETLRIITAGQVENATKKTIRNIKNIIGEVKNQYESRLDKYDNEINTLEEQTKYIYSFLDSYREAIYEGSSKAESDIEAGITNLYSLKNKLIKEFIKSLSSIRVNNHNIIKEAIFRASIKCFDIMNNEVLTQLKEVLISIFSKSADNLIQYKHSVLYKVLDDFNIEYKQYIDSENTDKEAVDLFIHEINKVPFTWGKSPMPIEENLEKCNVIEVVAEAIDFSINNFIKDMKINAIRGNEKWISYLQLEEESIRNAINRMKEEAKVTVNESKKLYMSNYPGLCKRAEDIYANCQVIMKENNEYISEK